MLIAIILLMSSTMPNTSTILHPQFPRHTLMRLPLVLRIRLPFSPRTICQPPPQLESSSAQGSD